MQQATDKNIQNDIFIYLKVEILLKIEAQYLSEKVCTKKKKLLHFTFFQYNKSLNGGSKNSLGQFLRNVTENTITFYFLQ